MFKLLNFQNIFRQILLFFNLQIFETLQIIINSYYNIFIKGIVIVFYVICNFSIPSFCQLFSFLCFLTHSIYQAYAIRATGADGGVAMRGDREDRKRAEQGPLDSAIHEASGRERRCKSLSCSINPTLDIALPEVIQGYTYTCTTPFPALPSLGHGFQKRENIGQERGKISKSSAIHYPAFSISWQTCFINSLIVQVVFIVNNLHDPHRRSM